MYKNNLITGITDLLVLSFLNEKGDSYVYEINKYFTSNSMGKLSISPNTIYTVMYKLEEEKLVSEYSKLVGKKRTRVYYHLESKGKIYLKELITNYNDTISGVQQILNSLKQGGNTNE